MTSDYLSAVTTSGMRLLRTALHCTRWHTIDLVRSLSISLAILVCCLWLRKSRRFVMYRLLFITPRQDLEECQHIFKVKCHTGHETPLWSLMARRRPAPRHLRPKLCFIFSVYIYTEPAWYEWMSTMLYYTVKYRYNALMSILVTYRRRPMARPLGRDMGRLLWFHIWLMNAVCCGHARCPSSSCNWPRYIGIRQYAPTNIHAFVMR